MILVYDSTLLQRSRKKIFLKCTINVHTSVEIIEFIDKNWNKNISIKVNKIVYLEFEFFLENWVDCESKD